MPEGPAYTRAHERVRRTKGSASSYPCISCGSPAQQWAYQHTGSGLVDGGLLYSDNPDDYAPMCRLHHKRLDASVRPEAAKNGAVALHAKAAVDASLAEKLRETRSKNGATSQEAGVGIFSTDPGFLERMKLARSESGKKAIAGILARRETRHAV